MIICAFSQIIQEKQKFKQAPVNFAMKKTFLMKERETAITKYVVVHRVLSVQLFCTY